MNSEGELQMDEMKLSSLLLTVGVLPSKAGFRYLKEGIMNYRRCNGVMNVVCNVIGKKYGVSKESVERDMRTALEAAVQRGWLVRFNDMIHIEVYREGERVRTKDFIATMTEYINMIEFENTPSSPEGHHDKDK